MEEQGPPQSVGDLMARYSGGRSHVALRNFGIRLSDWDRGRLEILGRRLGVPAATLARDLLRAALAEAYRELVFEDPGDESDFYSELAELQDEVRQREEP